MREHSNEKRGDLRARMLKGGIIAFSGRHATMPCVVRDMSDGGARLQVAQGSAVPDTFELLVELDGLEVPCQIAWRRVGEVGVSFLEKPRHAPPKRAQVVGQSGPVGRSTLRRVPQDGSAHRESLLSAKLAAVPTIVAPSAPVRPATATFLKPNSARAASTSIPILIAEDDPDDRLLMRDAFAESQFTHPIDFVDDGVELLKYVRGEAPYQDRPYPGLILLDLNMPRMDGRTALMHLKTHSSFKRIPVIVLTTSMADDDIQRTYDLGVTAYVSKPGTHQGLLELVECLNNFWTRFVSLPAA